MQAPTFYLLDSYGYTLNEIKNDYEKQSDSRYGAARLWVDEIIFPNETRKKLTYALDVISNINDQQYFPIIISLSNLNFSPTYLDNLNDYNTISFPIFGVLLHALFLAYF